MRRVTIQMRAHFSSKSLVAITKWDDIFKVLGWGQTGQASLFPFKSHFQLKFTSRRKVNTDFLGN